MTTLLCLLSLLLVQQPVRAQLGTVSGQLRALSGVPVAGTRVFAIPVESGADVATLASIAQADSEGRYRLEGLPPGRYRIAAGRLDFPNYFPGVATQNEAQILTVGLGQIINNLDFATVYGTVSGQIRARSGVPVSGSRVFAMAEADGGVSTMSITQADGEGRYRLEGLPPGRYWIATGAPNSPNYYPGVENRNQAQIQTIAPGQARANLDFVFVFPTVTQLWGRVEFDDGSPLPVGTLPGIMLILSSDSVHWTASPFTNQQGTFFFQNFTPGDYSVTLAPLPLGLGYLKSMSFGSQDLTRTPLSLTEVVNNTEIKVVLTRTRPASAPVGVKVSGRAVNAPPLVLNALSSTIDKVNPGDVSNPIANLNTNADGSFVIEGVPPGRYTIGPKSGKGAVPLPLEVAGSEVSGLNLDFPKTAGPRGGPRFPVTISTTSIRSVTGTIEMAEGTVPKFELRFSPTTRGVPTPVQTVVVSGKDFVAQLPEAEYRLSVSGLPDGYTVESITAGPLDLREPFLVTSRGIADRFTGVPIQVRSAAAITVRLKAPR